MAQMKNQVWSQLDMARTESLEESNRVMAQSLKRPDFKEGVASFVENETRLSNQSLGLKFFWVSLSRQLSGQ